MEATRYDVIGSSLQVALINFTLSNEFDETESKKFFNSFFDNFFDYLCTRTFLSRPFNEKFSHVKFNTVILNPKVLLRAQ